MVGGQELTYTLHFENTGAATGTVDKVDDLTHVLDDAKVTSEPVASNDEWNVARDDQRISISGDLAAGETVTVSYTVTVNESEDRGDDVLANFLQTPGEDTPSEPVCESPEDGRADCTTNPVGDISPAKSVDPKSGTEVKAGQELTYTLSFDNTGKGATEVDYVDHMGDILDDAQLVGEPEASDGLTIKGPEDNQLLISGSVADGETATVTYKVKVNAYDKQADHHLGNFLTVAGQEPPAQCATDNLLCTENPVPGDPGDNLPRTGATGVWMMLILGALLTLTGGGAVFMARRRGMNS